MKFKCKFQKKMRKIKLQIKLKLAQNILKFVKNLKKHKPHASDLQKTTSLIFQIKHFHLLQLKTKVKTFSKTFLKIKRKLNSITSTQNICPQIEKNT